MSTLKEATDDTTDRQESKKLAHLKCYSFVIFYSEVVLRSPLQKVSFKIREGSSPQSKSFEQEKQVQMSFYQLESEEQRIQGLAELRATSLESKSKLVGYCGESQLLELLQVAHSLGIDTGNIPLILVDRHPNSDLAIFSGWKSSPTIPFHKLLFSQLQALARSWMQAASQKIDLWAVNIALRSEGRIEKLQGNHFVQIDAVKGLQIWFLSHLSLGRHVNLTKGYQMRKKSAQNVTANQAIFGIEKLKNFCCIGASNILSSTGVVSISFKDDKGRETEILKHFRQYDGSEESDLETKKVVRSDQSIHSLLLANIDRFHGNKLDKLSSKPGDGKLEMALFQGVSSYRRLASVGGCLLVKVEGQFTELQVGEQVYRCWGASQLKVQQRGKLKVAISREALSC